MSHTLLMNPTAYEAALQARLSGLDHDMDVRLANFERFAQTGLPHRRMEAWKWTDLRTALQEAPVEGDAATLIAPSKFSDIGLFSITLDDDGAHWGADVPAGVSIRVTDEVPRLMASLEDHPMASLAAALSMETLVISIADGAEVHAPLHLFRSGNQDQAHRRVLLSVGKEASVHVFDSLEGGGHGNSFDNILMEVRLDEGAHCIRTSFTAHDDLGVDNTLFAVEMDARASFESYALLNGAKRARNEGRIHFQAPEATARLFSVSMVRDDRHADLTSHIVHDAEQCFVEQQHRSVIADRANSVFQGKFLVERSGQKTDANMQAKALLLDETATIHHKPELEIYADDVQCAHGSTSGALDDEALFYLRQRGLDEPAARALLVDAFVGEIFDEMPEEKIADLFRAHGQKFLNSGDDG